VPAEAQQRVGGGVVGSPSFGAGAHARPSQQLPSPVHSIGDSMHIASPLVHSKFVQTRPMPQSMSDAHMSPIMPMPMPIGLSSG